jgi:hypothetical protein
VSDRIQYDIPSAPELVSATLATIRDRWDRPIASVQAKPAADNLAISLHLEKCSCDLPWKKELASLNDQKLMMLLSGVLRFTAQNNGHEEIVYLDEFLARISDGQLRLVYDRDGINQALQMLEAIWQ